MLRRDEFTTTTLRGLKSAIGYEEVAKGKRDEGLSENELLAVIQKQVKQRDDSIAIYTEAGDNERADKETREKEILSQYLPAAASEEEITTAVDKAIQATNATSVADMGKVIGMVKSELGVTADGATIARITKEKLSQGVAQ
jgi:uncharacterized protein YqeY